MEELYETEGYLKALIVGKRCSGKTFLVDKILNGLDGPIVVINPTLFEVPPRVDYIWDSFEPAMVDLLYKLSNATVVFDGCFTGLQEALDSINGLMKADINIIIVLEKLKEIDEVVGFTHIFSFDYHDPRQLYDLFYQDFLTSYGFYQKAMGKTQTESYTCMVLDVNEGGVGWIHGDLATE